MNPLKHVAIIMDGNGRWGLKNKNSRNAGHRAGLNTVEKIIKETIKNNIKPIPKSKKGLIKELIRSEIIIKPTMFKVIDIKRIIVK